MYKVYPAIIHEEDGYWVEFPDLPGCQSYGDTVEDTMIQAEVALGLYLATKIECNEPLPKPSSIKELPAPDDGYVNYVSVELDKYIRNNRAVKKTISLPAWLAEEAEANNISLSKLLQDRLKERLGF